MSHRKLFKEALKISLFRELPLVLLIVVTGVITFWLVLNNVGGRVALSTGALFLYSWTEVVRTATAQYEFLKYERYRGV